MGYFGTFLNSSNSNATTQTLSPELHPSKISSLNHQTIKSAVSSKLANLPSPGGLQIQSKATGF